VRKDKNTILLTNVKVLKNRDDALEHMVNIFELFLGAVESLDVKVARKTLAIMLKIGAMLIADTKRRIREGKKRSIH